MPLEEPICSSTNEGEELFDRLHREIAAEATEHYVKELIAETGLEYLGQGDHRVAFLDRSGEYLSAANACVVKVNKYGENDANLTEFENYQSITGSLQKRLMRITDWDKDHKWLVMPYVSTEVTEEMLKELEIAFLEKGYNIKDVNKRNCARVQDRAVMIDYDKFIGRADFDIMDMEERKRLIEWRYE